MTSRSKYTRVTLRVFDLDWDDALAVARDNKQGLLDVLEAAITIGVAQLQRESEARKAAAEAAEADPIRAMMAALVAPIGIREAARALVYHRWHPHE